MTQPPCPHSRWTELFAYSTDFHDRFRVVRCAECGGVFLCNSWERVDWEDGRDRQFASFQPLTAPEVEEHRRQAAQWGPD